MSPAQTDQTQPEIDRLRSILAFLQAAEQLKNTLRSATTSQGRTESTAEHTWRLSLMIMMFDKDLLDCDLHRLLKLCIVHDLGEAISGDIPAIYQDASNDKAARERADLIELCTPLPQDLHDEILGLWDEYDAAATPEAILAKGFDKLETILQHAIGKNAPEFDYAFNLTYGATQTDRHPLLRQIRQLADKATRDRMAE